MINKDSTAGRSNVAMTGFAADAARILRIGGTRFSEGMRACEWGCRQWVRRGLQEKHRLTCNRRISACKYECGIAIREEQWAIIRERHYQGTCFGVVPVSHTVICGRPCVNVFIPHASL